MSKENILSKVYENLKYLLKNRFKETIIFLIVIGLLFILGFRSNIKIHTSWLTLEIRNLDSEIVEARR